MGPVAGGGWALADPDQQQAFITNAEEVAADGGMMRARSPQDGRQLSWRDNPVD